MVTNPPQLHPPATRVTVMSSSRPPLKAVDRVRVDERVPRQLLRLLGSDATVDELRAVVEQAVVSGGPHGHSTKRLSEDLRFSLLIKSELEERRRREHELAALFETAGDLTSIRDVEDVLRAIVQRVRNLLGSETAYLMLVDEKAGDTYMRVGEGVTTRVFSRIHLPLGGGLGGLVAQDACPYSTADYLCDLRFEHHASVDSAVREEGLVAIMGVPLMLAGRLLGVLFVAERHERRYSRQETALLLSLANHAAVALENARLFRESQVALAELAAAKALIEDHSREVERSVAAHERLTDQVLRGGGLQDVAEALADVLDGTILVVAPTGQILGSGGEPVDDLDQQLFEHQQLGSIPHDLLGALGEAEQARRTLRAELSGWLEPRWITPIVAGGQVLACLVLATRRRMAPVDVRTLERAAQVTALLLVWQRSAAEAEQRARGDLIDDLLAPVPPARESIRRRCKLLGVRPEADYTLVVAHASGGDHHRCASAAATLAAERNGLAGQHDSLVVILLPGLGATEAADLVCDRLSRQLRVSVTCGADGAVALLDDLASCHDRARRTLHVLLGLGRHGTASAASQLGIYSLLFGNTEEGHLRRFVNQRLAALVEYDVEHRTDLVATLNAYLSTGRRHTATAQHMHIHVNTLYQRLQRISELAGIDFEDADNVLEVHLALRLHQLTRDV